MKRRTFITTLSGAATIGGISAYTLYQPPLTIDLYYSETVRADRGAENIQLLKHYLQRFFDLSLDQSNVNIRVQDSVAVNDNLTAGAVDGLDWWQYSYHNDNVHDSVDAALLVTSSTDFEWDDAIGRATIGSPYAISSGLEHIEYTQQFVRLAAHEISHCLGLTHDMATKWADYEDDYGSDDQNNLYTLMHPDANYARLVYSYESRQSLSKIQRLLG